MTTETKPTLWQRINPFYREKRAIDFYGGERNDLFSESLSTPEMRRLYRSNADILKVYGAVFAAIRKRSRAVAKPRICLVRDVAGEEVEVDDHPALMALKRVNESLTQSQGFGLIEQHKLTHGKAYWVKRRDGLGTPVEFEIWPPDRVRPVPRKDKPWVVQYFEHRLANGTEERVAPEDIIHFRHMIDPSDPLNGLSPIGAVRTEVNTGIEAQRFNRAFFDNAIHLGQIYTAEDLSLNEADRVEQEMERKFKGSDKAFRTYVGAGGLKAVETKPPHKDMEFLKLQQWDVEEVSRVFEMAPELLGLGSRTYQNAPEAERSFWAMIVDQVEATLDEFNEFYLWPDFGEDLRFVARCDEIEALQANQKERAEVDEIYLRSGKTFINEVRERDGEEGVEWGEVPLMPLGTVPLGTVPSVTTPQQLQEAVQGEPEEPRSRSVAESEASIETNWEKRFRIELKALEAHFAAADSRDLEIADVNSFDWDWWQRYGKDVTREFEILYMGILTDTGFVETPMMSARELASRWATERGAELLRLDGRANVVQFTRKWVNGLVSQTIEQGESLQTLVKNLRSGFGFSRSRADMIARTETATALTKGSLKSYQSLGHEGKQWLTAQDERVDGGDPSGPCQQAEGEGPIPLGSPFNTGFEGPPAHPRCRCVILPVRELPRAMPKTVRKVVERDEQGRIVAVVEEDRHV